MIALTNIARHFKIKLNAPLITLKIMHFKSSPSGAVALQWQHWSICLDFPCRSNLWVSLSHHSIKGHFQLGYLSSLSRHLNVKIPRERKMRVNVFMHGVINWSECVGNYTQVGKSKRFGEKSLALNSHDKELLSWGFFSEKTKSQLPIIAICREKTIPGRHMQVREVRCPHFLHKKKVCTEYVLSREMEERISSGWTNIQHFKKLI